MLVSGFYLHPTSHPPTPLPDAFPIGPFNPEKLSKMAGNVLVIFIALIDYTVGFVQPLFLNNFWT